MGPYCNFCGQRCFVPILDSWPSHIRDAYGRCSIAATCRAGQAFERQQVGFCYDDARAKAKTVSA